MFDFARNVLGTTYVIVFILGLLSTALLVGPIVEHNRLLGIVLLLGGAVGSMYLASGVKLRMSSRLRKKDTDRGQT